MTDRAYNVTLLRPPGYKQATALWDICSLLKFSLESLGYPSTLQVNGLRADAVNIVLGYHLAPDPSVFGSHHIVIYQLEQLSEREGLFNADSLKILQRAQEIWDYSPANVEFLKARGVANVRLLPIGFHPRLRTIAPEPEEFDVLFYGTINDRRARILQQIDRRCRLKVLVGVFTEERDTFIARSKIVLNIHYYEARIAELARLSYLLNNARFVVSEASEQNPYEGMLVTADYGSLPDVCLRFLHDEPARRRIAEEGFERFRRQPMIEYLRAVL